MSKQAFNLRLEALEAVRAHLDPESARQALARALKDRNNYLVARAAAITADLRLDLLIPELLTAFDRFMTDPIRSDPHCLAKMAIASALRELGHHGAPVYLRGIRHVQLEPAWGGRADTAAGLRGTCALALVDCPLDDLEILTYLTDALADPDKTVRIDAARALEQLNRPEGGLLLRLKALIGDPDLDVMGQCFSSMLSLAPTAVVAFISRFLKSASEDVQLEAASALAQCRDPEAIQVLREYWQDPLVALEVRQALLINLGASPLPEAADFLLGVVAREPAALAGTAVGALATSRFQREIRERLSAAVEERDSHELRILFGQKFGGTPARR
jgi:HEAT repeat protein